jgi:hypothetical protein
MTYRLYQPNDEPEIWQLCRDRGIATPSIGICFVSVGDDGKIKGFINGGQIGFVESIVAETAISADHLQGMLEAVLLVNTQTSILVGVTNPAVGKILERQGYERVEQEFYIKKR